MRRINQNEKVLEDSLIKLNSKVTNVTLELQQEIEQVTIANMQIKTIERGLMECQHGCEILVDALIHAEQGTFQPQFVTAEKIKTVVTAQICLLGLSILHFLFQSYNILSYLMFILTSTFSGMYLTYPCSPQHNSTSIKYSLFQHSK
jgi:hypothetical protein